MKPSPSNCLIWIDLEMTGLDVENDSILEIATLITDNELNELAEGPVFAIAQPLETLQAMDDWNRSHHGDSGLWQRVLDDGVSLAEAEAGTLAFVSQWTEAGQSPMCGNSICQDRRFLHREMPKLEAWFHYRHLDVSSLKVLASHWLPEAVDSMQKQGLHQALADIRDSVAELRHYRTYMGAFSGLEKTPKT